ncbi:MAG: SDR family NAD(P)-dependent oxidoreductase [Armatimonadetes bacterium]|nr:SDR family NAD(P)-dependent oxidoreductase [Armatimonadota bacterium]MDE2206502.1 SDR family NAD(P)-dependent oxidoreductase [Armatimonadota bacterium]
MTHSKVAVVTGASSGIGAACVSALSAAGFHVVCGARRVERLNQVARTAGGDAWPLDVADAASVRAFCEHVPNINLLVNNAGGALGLDRVSDATDEDWQQMFDSNVLGLMRMTRELLPRLEQSGDGHVINIGSIAGREVYAGGSGYNAMKFGVRAITRALRVELLGKPVRVTEIVPGMVETEFSEVRFRGDKSRAAQVYAGLTPLTAGDVADCVVWAATRPAHVNVDEIVVKPLAQASVTLAHRAPG